MSQPLRWYRLASSDVAVQVHVTHDSKFIVMPMLQGAVISGWLVYDTANGDIVWPEEDDGQYLEGYEDGAFARIYQARDWVAARYYAAPTD